MAEKSKNNNQALKPKNLPKNWHAFYQAQSAQVKNELLQKFYRGGLVDFTTPLKDVEFVALDFETTGLNSSKDGIISIGLIPFTLDRIYCNQSRHWLVNPKKPLEEDSVVIHGITHSDLSDAPDLRRILEQVLDALAGKVVVAHYRAIEREFFDRALKERIGEGIIFPMIDTLEIEYDIQKQANRGFFKRLFGRKMSSVRLGASRDRYGLPTYQPHHALVDAIATAELLQAQILHHYSPDMPIESLWK